MPARTFDVIVAGLGAMGSATAYHLARRGHTVLGFDRFTPPHALGSSHGKSRIIREAYFEHPSYVPLAQRAYDAWAALEAESGRTILVPTGGVTVGAADSETVRGARLSAIQHNLLYEELSAAELRRRVPAFQPIEDMVAIWEPRASVLLPEVAVETHLALARRHGAQLHYDEPVTAWRADGDGVVVTTTRDSYRANRSVLTAGAGTLKLLADLHLPLAIERQVMLWFRPTGDPALLRPPKFPIFIGEHSPGHLWYGMPDLGEGLKAAIHHAGVRYSDPDAVDREVHTADVAAVRALIRRFIPTADGEPIGSAVCIYTNTPDSHFLIDFHPVHQNVIIGTPCSGHGFKFSTVIGELLADLALTGRTEHNISMFGLKRMVM